MADPNNPIHADDIHFQDRGGHCFTLVDPTLPAGRRDVGGMWLEPGPRDVWRWRMHDAPRDGTPYPTAGDRDTAMERMLAAYAADPAVAARLEAQRPRFSFGHPQIVRA